MRTIRIVITAKEGNDGIENLGIKTYAWRDNGPALKSLHVNDIPGIMIRATMQQLGTQFIEGALRTARTVTENQIDVLKKVDVATATLDLSTSTLKGAIQLLQDVLPEQGMSKSQKKKHKRFWDIMRRPVW
jgi:hypothetical protein